MKKKEFNLKQYLYKNPLLESEDKKGKPLKETALRSLIREKITSILSEADEDVEDEEEEDVDVDIEDETEIEDEPEELDMKTEVPGEDMDISSILDLLTQAQEESTSLGDEKLMDQIGNTITYFTRAHVVKSTETRAEL